jgi:hypothetical protein
MHRVVPYRNYTNDILCIGANAIIYVVKVCAGILFPLVVTMYNTTSSTAIWGETVAQCGFSLLAVACCIYIYTCITQHT